MTDALVLSGAAIRGAFAAGALSVLFSPDVATRLRLDVTRLVGASAGALNATFLAPAVHAGTTAAAAASLPQVWIDEASATGAFHLSLADTLRQLGISTDDKVLEVLRRHVPPTSGAKAVDLRLVVTNADGEPITAGPGPATTFEHVFTFSGPDFETAEGLERVFVAAAASAAIPGLYAPVPVPVDGRSVRGLDGGIVDDSPLGLAIQDALDVDRVFVIAPYPRLRSPQPGVSGIALASHILDIIVDERLVRDLVSTYRVNDALARLATAVPDDAQRAAVLDALGWTGRRPVTIVEIRPDGELPGGSLDGFFSKDLRQAYVKAGIAAASATLSRL